MPQSLTSRPDSPRRRRRPTLTGPPGMIRRRGGPSSPSGTRRRRKELSTVSSSTGQNPECSWHVTRCTGNGAGLLPCCGTVSAVGGSQRASVATRAWGCPGSGARGVPSSGSSRPRGVALRTVAPGAPRERLLHSVWIHCTTTRGAACSAVWVLGAASASTAPRRPAGCPCPGWWTRRRPRGSIDSGRLGWRLLGVDTTARFAGNGMTSIAVCPDIPQAVLPTLPGPARVGKGLGPARRRGRR